MLPRFVGVLPCRVEDLEGQSNLGFWHGVVGFSDENAADTAHDGVREALASLKKRCTPKCALVHGGGEGRAVKGAYITLLFA